MANYNKVILVGNLTRDPQMSYLPTNNTPVVDVGLAVNRKWKDQQGNTKEEVCFIDCRAFGKTAEIINKYFSKGRQILIEGRLHFSQWEAKDGTKRSKHRVMIERFEFMADGQGQRGPGAPARGPAPGPVAAPAPPQAAPQAAPPLGEEQPEPPPADEEPPPSGEDIPF